MKPDTLLKAGIFLLGLVTGAAGTYLTFDDRVDNVEKRVLVVEMRITGNATVDVSMGPAEPGGNQ
jgi:hypothetical protein